MLNLQGIGLPVHLIREIQSHTRIRFRDASSFVAPEALILHEQQYMSDEDIDKLCEEAYGVKLYKPQRGYVPTDIISLFEGTNGVPISYRPKTKQLDVLILNEIGCTLQKTVLNYQVNYLPTVPYYYYSMQYNVYGGSPDLADVSPKILFDAIVTEAIQLKAMDVTISTCGSAGCVYYNVRKRIVQSKRLFSADMMREIIKLITARCPYDFSSRKVQYISIDLTKEYRGRIAINHKYRGYMISMRILPNEIFHDTLESLNLTPATAEFIRTEFLDDANGLRLLVGETASGKNTTALAALAEELSKRPIKCVSIEYPVEREIQGIEQIDCETIEEYLDQIHSLIRLNPDLIYVTEMGDDTGAATIHVTNTGKRVISTVHADSVEDVITRLKDICKISEDRVIQNLHSIIFQSLKRNEETDSVYPVNEFIRLTPELKQELYGKSSGEIIRILNERKEKG